MKNYNEAGMKKAAFGMKVMTSSVAFDASIDSVTKKYNAGLVYGVSVFKCVNHSTKT